MSGGFGDVRYDKFERAYVMERTSGDKASVLRFELAGSERPPVYNPCFVVRKWGDAEVRVLVDEKGVDRGKGLRRGYRRRLEGTDLIVCVKAERTEPMRISMYSAEGR